MVAVGGLAFGAIRGQDRQWQDPLAWASLAVGAVALVAFPFLMARRPNPLIPLGLFRRRRFATINLSTLLIYGALYTILTFQGLFLQGTIGYSATAAGVIGLPTGILLTRALDARRGRGRDGSARGRSSSSGPVMMAGGPPVAGAGPGRRPRPGASPSATPTTWLPPASVLVDILPSVLLFGVGISLVVAPLTTTLMGSVPVSNAGLASAINNAVSRVGQPLLSALIFVVVSGAFYAALAGAVPGFDSVRPGDAGRSSSRSTRRRRGRRPSSWRRPGPRRSTPCTSPRRPAPPSCWRDRWRTGSGCGRRRTWTDGGRGGARIPAGGRPG